MLEHKINDTFPYWIEALPELQVLVLHSNKFKGSIGSSKNPQSLGKLRIIDLSNNIFSGPLPTSYIENFRGIMNLSKSKDVHYMGETYHYSVDLVVKGLEIELVKILTMFTSIDLSCNNFEGEIPIAFGDLSSLRDLSYNKLGGQIPRELEDLTFLSFFNVSYNQLVGPVPVGKQFSTFENGSYEGNQGLCGFTLSRECNSNEQEQAAPWMNFPKDNDLKLEIGREVVAIGYGFGFIIGVAVGCGALRIGNPKWFVNIIS
ncbi:hypothetical protein PTKIN_Ptkin16aG0089700 [Pterospermum kingtungense]